MILTVTPGIDLDTINGPLSKTQFNALGQPTVALTAGTIVPADLDIAAVQEALSDAGPGGNYLRNGNMAKVMWTRGSTSTTCLVGVRTFRADYWACFPELVAPGTATMTYEREASGPANHKSLHCAKLTGNATITSVDFCQDIGSHLSAALRQNITLQYWLYNGTGAALTPLVRLDTADAADVWTAVTNRYSANAGAAVANATWVRYTHTIDATALTNMTNGLRVLIRIPSGALDSNVKFVRLTQAKLEIGESAGSFTVERDEVAETVGSISTALQRNYLDNGGFAESRWLNTSLTCTLSIDNYSAESWWCRPAGASTLVMSRETASPDTVTLHCAKLLGGAGVNDVEFGQNVERHVAGMTRRQLTFSVYLYNGTGSAFVPTLRVDTCDAEGAFGTVTNRLSQALDSCPNNAWTRLTFSLSGADYTNWVNGARIFIRIPSGSLDGVGKYVRIAQAQLALGTSALTFDPEPELTQEVAAIGAARGLVIRSATSATLTILADEIILKDAAGRARVATFPTVVTVDITTSGVNGLDTGAEAASTWYHIWAISDGAGTARGLLSLSSTAPTLPAGYSYRTRVGVVRNSAASNFISFFQVDRRVSATSLPVFTAKGPAVANTYESARTAATAGILESVVPPTAITIRGSVGRTTSGTTLFGLASDANGLGEVICNIASAANSFASFFNPIPFAIDISAEQDFSWKADNTGIIHRLEVSGYTLS